MFSGWLQSKNPSIIWRAKYILLDFKLVGWICPTEKHINQNSTTSKSNLEDINFFVQLPFFSSVITYTNKQMDKRFFCLLWVSGLILLFEIEISYFLSRCCCCWIQIMLSCNDTKHIASIRQRPKRKNKLLSDSNISNQEY